MRPRGFGEEALDSLSTMGGAVLSTWPRPTPVLDAVLAGPLQSRLPLIRKAVRGLSQGRALTTITCASTTRPSCPATSQSGCSSDRLRQIPKKLPETLPQVQGRQGFHKKGARLFSLIQVLAHVFKEEQATRAAAVRVMFGAVADRPLRH